jgi:acetylserotonin N-methyltransferase
LNQLAPPDPGPVLELVNAFRCSQVMFAAVSLGVFDRLEKGPATLSALAKELKAQVDPLGRLLDTAIGLGLLIRQNDEYANTPAASAYLTSNSPRRMTGYIHYSAAVLWKLWANLADAVREGSNRWKQAFGLEGPLFANFFKSEIDKREFTFGMHGFGQISSPEVVRAFDLGRFRKMVDLGGATGHLALAACNRYQSLRAVVFDLPAVMPLAREVVAASDVAGRVDLVAGDFFSDPLPDADLFAVGRILHDWDEDKIQQLLQVIFQRLPAGGALLVAEKILDDDRIGPRWAQLQSLNMLVCAEGKERTEGEYTALLRQAGFTKIEARRTNSPLDAILAVKPGET